MQQTFMSLFEPTAGESEARSTRLSGTCGVLVCLMILGSLAVSSVRAADSFTRVVMESGPNVAGAADVAPVDLDGDGDTDAVVVVESGMLTWFENDGTNVVFTAHTVDSGSRLAGALEVVPVDFDRDGTLDVVAAAGDTVVWYENGGAGQSFTRHVIDSGQRTDEVRDLDVEDLDGDGLPDVVVAVDDAFVWYENDGTGLNFIRHVIDSRSVSGARALRPVDLDGDGDQDAVGAASEGLFFYERKASNNPNRPDRFRRRRIARGSEVANTRDLEPVDVDGDGYTDLVLAAGDTIAWYRNQGNNRQFRRLVVDTGRPVAAARDVSVQDIDGDGTMDVLTASGDTFAWYQNDGANRGFTRHVIESGELAGGARDIEPVDVDGDGDQDVMTAAAGANEVAWQAQPNVFIVDDDGGADTGPVDCGAFTSAPTAVSDALSRVTVGDTVWVCPGTYVENLTLSTGKSHLTMRSAGDSTNTVLTPANPDRPLMAVSDARAVRVEGFSLRSSVEWSGVHDGLFRHNRLDTMPHDGVHLTLRGSEGNVLRSNRITDGDDTGLVLIDSDSNLVENNHLVDNRIGIIVAGRSDSNVFRANRIDTNLADGVIVFHATGGEPGSEGVNVFRNNTIRRSNTGVSVRGTVSDTAVHTILEKNNLASNFKGLKNLTSRVVDARANWWGDPAGPGGVHRDPLTGAWADGKGDSIVSVNWNGSIDAPDTNVAFDPWLDTQSVDVQPLPDTTNGCLVQRFGAPIPLVEGLRGLRDWLLSRPTGRLLTVVYYGFFDRLTVF